MSISDIQTDGTLFREIDKEGRGVTSYSGQTVGKLVAGFFGALVGKVLIATDSKGHLIFYNKKQFERFLRRNEFSEMGDRFSRRQLDDIVKNMVNAYHLEAKQIRGDEELAGKKDILQYIGDNAYSDDGVATKTAQFVREALTRVALPLTYRLDEEWATLRPEDLQKVVERLKTCGISLEQRVDSENTYINDVPMVGMYRRLYIPMDSFFQECLQLVVAKGDQGLGALVNGLKEPAEDIGLPTKLEQNLERFLKVVHDAATMRLRELRDRKQPLNPEKVKENEDTEDMAAGVRPPHQRLGPLKRETKPEDVQYERKERDPEVDELADLFSKLSMERPIYQQTVVDDPLPGLAKYVGFEFDTDEKMPIFDAVEEEVCRALFQDGYEIEQQLLDSVSNKAKQGGKPPPDITLGETIVYYKLPLDVLKGVLPQLRLPAWRIRDCLRSDRIDQGTVLLSSLEVERIREAHRSAITQDTLLDAQKYQAIVPPVEGVGPPKSVEPKEAVLEDVRRRLNGLREYTRTGLFNAGRAVSADDARKTCDQYARQPNTIPAKMIVKLMLYLISNRAARANTWSGAPEKVRDFLSTLDLDVRKEMLRFVQNTYGKKRGGGGYAWDATTRAFESLIPVVELGGL